MKTARQGGHPVVTGTMLEAATPPRAAGTEGSQKGEAVVSTA